MADLTSSRIKAFIDQITQAYEDKLKATVRKKKLIGTTRSQQTRLINSIETEVKQLSNGWQITVWFSDHGRIIENLSYKRNKIRYKENSLIVKRPSKYRWYRRNNGQFVETIITDLTQEYANEILDKTFHILDYFE